MKKHTISIIVISIISLLIAFSGCKKSDPDTEEYIIQIDSIIHPDTISFGESLEIKFYGVVGSNGCYAFYKFEPVYTNATLSVTTWGILTNDDMCTEEIPYIVGETLMVNNMPAGEMTIDIIQADGYDFTSSVYVTE